MALSVLQEDPVRTRVYQTPAQQPCHRTRKHQGWPGLVTSGLVRVGHFSDGGLFGVESLRHGYHTSVPTLHSPLSTHHSPLSTHHSPLTTHHSSLLPLVEAGKVDAAAEFLFQELCPHLQSVESALHEREELLL
jgi:hypothetical protein